MKKNIYIELLYDLELNNTAKIIYLKLLKMLRQNTGEVVKLEAEEIAQNCCCSVETVYRRLRDLKAKGYIWQYQVNGKQGKQIIAFNDLDKFHKEKLSHLDYNFVKMLNKLNKYKYNEVIKQALHYEM